MSKVESSRRLFPVYASSMALCSLIVSVTIVISPSEPGNTVFLGLSLTRLILAIGFLCATVFFGALAYKAFKDRRWAETVLEQWFGEGRLSRWLAGSAGIGLGLGWVGTFLPAYRTGVLEPHWNRIQPLLVFLLITSVITLVMFLQHRSHFSIRSLQTSKVFRLGLSIFLASLPVLGWMLYSKYGIYSLEDFWYGAGVPILASQLIAAILGGVLFLWFGRNWNTRRSDLAIFVLVYLVTAVLWASEPLQRSFVFTQPRPPNEVLYPFADSAAFDTGSQFALIGQGIYIFNNSFTDRPLYLSLLVYLHSLFGQDYELLMAAQAAVFAIHPALIYLIGKSLGMRAVGFGAALMAMLRGINSIAGSNLMDMAGPKMIMSDFPAAIGVALIILLVCEWLKEPQEKRHYALWVGGAIGLTLMIRPHALIILLLVPLYALLRFAPRWKSWLAACALIGLGVVAVTLPWELRNVSRGGVMYSSIVTKVQDVIRTRYIPIDVQGSLPPLDKVISTVTFQHTAAISHLYQHSNAAQEQVCSSIVCFAPKHFLHNIITSLLILPTSPILDDLPITVKGDLSYWRADWQGAFTPVTLFFLLLNVFFIGLGISVAWKHRRLSGLAPLAVFGMYILANSVARTSGGRYIVPADWILSLYFMGGVLYLFREIVLTIPQLRIPFFDPAKPKTARNKLGRSPWLTVFFMLSLLIGTGSVVPVSEMLHSPRYAGVDVREVLQARQTQIVDAGLEIEQLNEFLASPGAELLVGRTMYPRSYRLGLGEIAFVFYPYTTMDFPRTGFFLLGPNGQDNIILAGRAPEHLPHAEDALVIGCREQNYLDALVVIILDETGTVHTRSPMPELSCPMPQPVCENNNECE
jgi:hypothetical protein